MTEDSQQISVAELLKRNGQSVESRGGRRRRGVAGGISVAELTGEIPIVRPAGSRSAAEPDVVTEPEAVTEPKAAVATKPVEAKPDVAKPDVAKVVETKPVEAKPDVAKPVETKPVATRPVDETQIDLHKPVSKSVPGQWVSRTPSKQPAAPAKSVPAAPAKSVPAAPAKSMPVAPARVTQEPALLSGQTLAGDLMRQEREVAQNAQSPAMRAPVLPPRVAPTAPPAPSVDVSTELMDRVTDKVDADPAETAVVDMTDALGSPTENPVADAAVAPVEVATEDAETAESDNRSSIREWAMLAGQVVVALIIGGAMFKGFEKLWDMLPWVALVLALIVIVGLVAVVRVLRKTDDITSFVIAVVVGMIVTLGPLAFLLTSG
ncbi:hypothetical protein [Rhodococcus sp. OK302]|uniref:hypothetical protein n=1 Tax=Rhodococcus sp. OK302 TaxID=1882769 RepID=UPI000B940524|nr:hypothetical protein [Rhodococcus sp. OK302]OYD68735.1 hypothetical protein BDB13_2289 [Rhodococcus sp. OK302]